MKVLIVEDDPVTQHLLGAFLTEWEYDIQVVGDGRAAWKALQETEAPNLVISDWMMPDMNGVELCKKICAMNKTDYTYFILLTSKGSREDIIEGLQSFSVWLPQGFPWAAVDPGIRERFRFVHRFPCPG